MIKGVVIIVQQQTLRERPRIHKLAKVLAAMDVPFEVWKFGEEGRETFDGIAIRNLMSTKWLRRHPVSRYLAWMVHVYVNALKHRRDRRFFAVGFDSALPIACLPLSRPALIFDNIDNVSMSYRWPPAFRAVFRTLETWVAHRAQIHVNPSRVRWATVDRNLRIVTNTPSAETLAEAEALARERGYARGREFTVYLNGWLSSTRGISTLIAALEVLRWRGRFIRLLVAGRPSCQEAQTLLAMQQVEYLGMLTNAEALANYYRSDLAFIYYDPAIEINRLAESQKWTDCWATGTPFVSNVEIQTLQPYIGKDACFALGYHDVAGLAALIESLLNDGAQLNHVRDALIDMKFKFWDEEMRLVMREWLALGEVGGSER